MTVFDWIIWIGAGVTAAGLALLLWCILTVLRARRNSADDVALRTVMQRVVPVNLAALLLSALGLMLVTVGIILG